MLTPTRAPFAACGRQGRAAVRPCPPVQAQPQQVALLAAGILMLSPANNLALAQTTPSNSALKQQITTASEQQQQQQKSSGPMEIAFVPVSEKVRDQLNSRDEMMAWKCLGKNMYDCDGSREKEAEEFWDNVKGTFKVAQ